MNSFNTPTPNFDNLLIQTLMSKLQLRPSPPSPLSNQSLEDILFNNLNLDLDLDLDDSDNDDSSPSSSKSHLAKEESKLEKEIIRKILSSKTEDLKPNSGQAVSIGEHHICVGFHEDTGSEYRVWEWHGHIMLFDEEDGYTPEYIYGNYFERVVAKEAGDVKRRDVIVDDDDDDDDDDDEKEDEKATNLGLKDLVQLGEENCGRILHRNVNAASPRF